jgi:hypothetical protein
MEEEINAYRDLVRKLERTRQFRRLKSKWEYNIRADIQELDLESVNWCNFARNIHNWRADICALLRYYAASSGSVPLDAV